MSKWFFSSKENQEALIKELKEWRGTPFRHRAAVKKVGADCVNYVAKVFETVGAVKDAMRKVPYYGHDWSFHTSEQKFYNALKKRREFEQVKFNSIMNGDLILYHYGLAASHCAVYFDGNIYHAINLVGVQRVYYKADLWYKRRRFLFRVKYV